MVSELSTSSVIVLPVLRGDGEREIIDSRIARDSQGLDEDLHASTQAQHEVERRLLLQTGCARQQGARAPMVARASRLVPDAADPHRRHTPSPTPSRSSLASRRT